MIIVDIYQLRRSIFELAKRDFQKQYAGSYLGMVWMFLQPLLFVGILYTVFTYGFRSAPDTVGMPFAVYLVTGIISWNFFADNLNGMTQGIREHGFLAKRADFRLSILPLVKLGSTVTVHAFLVVFALLIAVGNGVIIRLEILQILYYFISMSFLLIGIGWITSSALVFVKDTGKIVAIITQFGFWLTPIFWSIDFVPEEYQWIPKLNPMYYITMGYRDSFSGSSWFWERPGETAYFWLVAMIVFLIGLQLFRRLRPHFAEVL